METALDIFYCVTALVALTSLGLEYKRCLTMLQQNSYINSRYRAWLSQSSDTTAPMRLISVAVLLVSLAVTLSTMNWSMLLVLVTCSVDAWQTARVRYKKPLVVTRRVWRLATVQMLLSAIAFVGLWLLFDGGENAQRGMFIIALTALGLYCASHLVTMLSNWLLRPVERAINARYRRDARRILEAMPGLKVVGVTGSYGKTSTKHFLHRILSEKYDTLMTPGNFNTTLGVIRTVREHLKPYNEVFIVEMGAKQPGDIADICRLVHPTVGIVTAVGPQHLETFKTIDAVQATKFELVDALPPDGLAIVNNDFEKIASRPVQNVPTARYAVQSIPEGGWHVEGIEPDADGTRFTLLGPQGERLDLHTRLLGEANISDLAAAVIAALHLGVEPARIAYAVSCIEPVEHRLSVRRTPGGVTIVDDAYNSNPVGSAMAMDVLAMMPCRGKRIVVTPGMVELGDEQEALNQDLGEKIAGAADVAVIVNRLNRDALCAGLERGGMSPAAIRRVDSFAEAQQLLATLLAPGDIVLYENDLPDTFK